MSVSFSRALRTFIGFGCALTVVGVAACSSDENAVIRAPEGGSGGMPGAAGSAQAGGGAGGSVAGGGSGGALAGAGGALAGAAGQGGSSGGASGSAGAAGNGGSGGAGACTPGTPPTGDQSYSVTGWAAQWSEPCNFQTNNPKCDTLSPGNAFDGKGGTRTSLGDTHLKDNNNVAQKNGDAFTFDMKGCNTVGRVVMYTGAPPDNKDASDSRDFPGKAEVTVSSDCTSNNGVITGTFGPVVASADEPQPDCNSCNKPMTFTIDPPVPAKCVRITLRGVLKKGGGIWWAIGEIQTFAK